MYNFCQAQGQGQDIMQFQDSLCPVRVKMSDVNITSNKLQESLIFLGHVTFQYALLRSRF